MKFGDDRGQMKCSFCGKAQEQVRKLIQEAEPLVQEYTGPLDYERYLFVCNAAMFFAMEGETDKAQDMLDKADAIAFASPVYWYTFPAGFKAVMDKFYSLCRAGKDLAGKKCVLMSCCEDDNMKAFEGVLFSYKESMGLLRCEDVGQVLVKDVHRPGAVLETDAPQRCRQLARELLAAIE